MNKTEFVEQIKNRTKKLSINIILFYNDIDKTEVTRIIGEKLIRSVTSVAANYRAASISRSQREFFSKISVVVEEALETLKIVSKARKNANPNNLKTLIH